MRICLDTVALRPPLTGIGYYVMQLAEHLLAEAHDNEFYAFDGFAVHSLTHEVLVVQEEQTLASAAAASASSKALANSGGLKGKVISLARKSNTARRLYRFIRARRFQQIVENYDLFHALNFVPPLETKRTVLPLIHDLSFERLPETHPAERVSFLRERLKSISHYPFINTLSNFSASEIADVYGYPIERIGVTYPGVSARMHRPPDPKAMAQVAEMGLKPNSFFLSVGTVEPRKNHKVLIEAYVGLPPAVRQRCPLIIVGTNGWGKLDVPGQDALVADGSVRFSGYASEELVRALYEQARALLFPTLYEGFGLPVVEAMACGTQPVVSEIPVMREVAGDVGIFIDPHDVSAWRTTLAEIAADDSRFASADLLRQRAGLFTWEATARQTLALYERFK